ncbi:reverse transcriptase [Elysia marginata]|uniref:Reverse transcriptase n=1 Tax=Elysia marginata TaxID=1093978 RepID=A0AAV4HIG7_9GAST|nr:reverse transcriptase [Elysia marginata]
MRGVGLGDCEIMIRKIDEERKSGRGMSEREKAGQTERKVKKRTRKKGRAGAKYRPNEIEKSTFHSTETALLKVTSDVFESIDQKEICVMTLLDLSAAFDTIGRNILLTRLNQTFGLSGTVLQWFESYLSNRTQSVCIGDHTSRKLPLVFGVPQGSVLGPILFTLYTSPLSSIIKLLGMPYHLYADDTQMYCTDTINNLPLLLSKTSICIESVKEWMMTNKLKLNDDKTEIIILGKDVHSIPTSTLNINGNIIPTSKRIKKLRRLSR